MSTDAPATSFAAIAAMTSWVEYGADSHFPVQNIPFGAFARPDGVKVCGTRIGNNVSLIGTPCALVGLAG